MTIGSDLDTPSTLRTQFIKEIAHHFAVEWKRHKYPVPFEAEFTVDTIRVRVQVGEAGEEPKIDKSAEQFSYE